MYIEIVIAVPDSNSELPGTEFLVKIFMTFLRKNVAASLTTHDRKYDVMEMGVAKLFSPLRPEMYRKVTCRNLWNNGNTTVRKLKV